MNTFDIVILLIVVFLTLIAAKRGFLRSILNFGAVLAAGIGSRVFAGPGAEYIYSNHIRSGLTSTLYEIMPSGSLGGEVNEGINRIFDSLPSFVTGFAQLLGISTDKLFSEQNSVLTVEYIEKDILGPLITRVAALIVTVVLFIVFSIIFKVIVLFITKKLRDSDHKLVKSTDMVLGGLFGLIRAIIPAGILCAVFCLLASVFSNEQLGSLVGGSYFCQLILNLF